MNKKVLAIVIIILASIVGHFVFVRKGIVKGYQTYTECIEKTKLPCKHYFVGDLGQEWRSSPYRSKEECDNAERVVGFTCVSPSGNFRENRWVNAADLERAKIETANWKTYKNIEYGFELTFNDSWSGYRVIRMQLTNNSGSNLVFAIPTTDSKYSDLSIPRGYYKAFVILALDKNAQQPSSEGPGPKFIASNQNYNFYVSFPQEITDDLINKIDANQAVKTFKLL